MILTLVHQEVGFPRGDSNLDKKFQIGSWWVTHGGKWCVYTKIMFSQNFRNVEKKLAEGSAYLVSNLWKPNFFILGTKTHWYELICHLHIEEDKTNPVCFMKKNQLDQEKVDLYEK